MSDPSKNPAQLPPEQQAIRAKCFHSTGTLVEFREEEIEQSIPERFEKIVVKYAERRAVKAGDCSFTYDELNRAANRIARAILQKRGPGSEPIALLFEHGMDVIGAILGTLKAGKFYVALDASFPAERINHILRDSGAGLVLTNTRHVDSLRSLTDAKLQILNINKIDDSVACDNLNLPLSPGDFASLIYTSGSSGTPKGVVGTHRIVLHSLVIFPKELRLSANDRSTLLHSVAFGSALTLLFHTLLNGGSLFPFDLKPQGIHRLASWLAEEQITACHFPPAVFRQLAEVISRQEKLSRLRLIHLSGAPITRQDFELYKKTFSNQTRLLIGMGSTEARWICYTILDHAFSFPSEGVPIGYPVPGTRVLLVDDNGHDVQPGQVGEIAVRSRYLTAGYWNQPALTSAKFLLDPGGGDERTYLTGDLGRMMPDGFFVHLGRKDFQVKIRGYRVDISEIERTLQLHPEIREAGVVALDREPGEKYLVAYVVPRQHSAPTIHRFFTFLRRKLPDYMVPSAFVLLDSLPLINGKLDRSALPRPDGKRPNLKQSYIAPVNEVEKSLVAIWEEILNVCPIGIDDNFFDLGGHSLAATRVVSQVIKSFQLELPLQSLFQSPTIAEMAAVITGCQGERLGERGMDLILAELETLTDEEAQRLLTDERERGH